MVNELLWSTFTNSNFEGSKWIRVKAQFKVCLKKDMCIGFVAKIEIELKFSED